MSARASTAPARGTPTSRAPMTARATVARAPPDPEDDDVAALDLSPLDPERPTRDRPRVLRSAGSRDRGAHAGRSLRGADPLWARLARASRSALPHRDGRGAAGRRLQRLAPPQPTRALLGVPDQAAPPCARHDRRPPLVDPAVSPADGDDHQRHPALRDRRRRWSLPRSPRNAL